MYSNIDEKIKIIAQIIMWVGIICSIIVGISLISTGTLKGIGIIVLIVGSLISWILSCLMYGFGELIEKTSEIAKRVSGESLTSKMEKDKKLETLIQWKENKLISEEEFEIKKQSILKGE